MTKELQDEQIEEIKDVESDEPDEAVATIDPEIAADARKYGWKPREEFTLAPDGWVDADRFLELPSTQLKMVRDLNRDMTAQLKDRDERLKRVESTSKIAIDRVREQARQDYEARVAAIEAEKRAAVEIGDTDRYDDLSRQQKGLKAPEIETVAQDAAPNIDPAIEEYFSRNTWHKDQHAYAFAFNAIETNPTVKALPPSKQLAWAEARVKEHFPELFPEPAAQRQSRVDSGGIGGGFKPRTKGADDLPAEARSAGETFVKEGVYKNLGDYAKDYFSEGAGQ